MKQIRMAAILMALVLGGLTSCTKDNSGTSSASTTSINKNEPVKGELGPVAAALEQARWAVNSYSGVSQNGSDFSGYEFVFGDGGYVAAIYGEVVYNGTWSTNEQAYNLSIDFGVTATVLNALKGEWHVTQLSNERISVQRTNGTASFTFVKVGPNTPQE